MGALATSERRDARGCDAPGPRSRWCGGGSGGAEEPRRVGKQVVSHRRGDARAARARSSGLAVSQPVAGLGPQGRLLGADLRRPARANGRPGSRRRARAARGRRAGALGRARVERRGDRRGEGAAGSVAASGGGGVGGRRAASGGGGVGGRRAASGGGGVGGRRAFTRGDRGVVGRGGSSALGVVPRMGGRGACGAARS